MADVIDLGYRPRAWQRKVHKHLKRFSVLVVHRRAGKTVLAVMTLIDAAIRTNKTQAQYAYIAPYLKQSKAIAWKYLVQFASKIPGIEINQTELTLRFPNGNEIRLYGADNPDALRGIYLDGVVMDEVAQMRPDTWGEVVRPALADRRGWALFLGTPKGANLFSELWHRASADPSWYAARFTVKDTDALVPDEVEAARREMSDAQCRQEFLCDFEAANENALIAVSLVDEARKRTVLPSVFRSAPTILGVDVARYGDDRTVILRRQGLMCFEPQILRGADSMAVAAAVAKQIDQHHPEAVFIDGSGGYGAGVIDRLRSLNYLCTEVQFGGKATDDRYQNKRTEMWFEMGDWLKGGGCLPDLSLWAVDLCGPTYTYANAQGKLGLESKDAIKARGLPSPDVGDALALTFAYPVAAPVHVHQEFPSLGLRHAMATTEFDPFAA
jgi:hypothetical protein